MRFTNIKPIKNKFTKIIKLSQHQYYVDRFENCGCNVQHTWREIKNILYEGRNTSNITEINCNGSLSKKPDIITNTFNEYFANVVPNKLRKLVVHQSSSFFISFSFQKFVTHTMKI